MRFPTAGRHLAGVSVPATSFKRESCLLTAEPAAQKQRTQKRPDNMVNKFPDKSTQPLLCQFCAPECLSESLLPSAPYSYMVVYVLALNAVFFASAGFSLICYFDLSSFFCLIFNFNAFLYKNRASKLTLTLFAQQKGCI